MKTNIPKWKQDSLAFRMAMKQVKGTKLTEEEVQLSKAVKEVAKSDLTKCKFCGRSFNETAAAKHIPLCEKKAKEEAIKKKAKLVKKY